MRGDGHVGGGVSNASEDKAILDLLIAEERLIALVSLAALNLQEPVTSYVLNAIKYPIVPLKSKMEWPIVQEVERTPHIPHSTCICRVLIIGYM